MSIVKLSIKAHSFLSNKAFFRCQTIEIINSAAKTERVAPIATVRSPLLKNARTTATAVPITAESIEPVE